MDDPYGACTSTARQATRCAGCHVDGTLARGKTPLRKSAGCNKALPSTTTFGGCHRVVIRLPEQGVSADGSAITGLAQNMVCRHAYAIEMHARRGHYAMTGSIQMAGDLNAGGIDRMREQIRAEIVGRAPGGASEDRTPLRYRSTAIGRRRYSAVDVALAAEIIGFNACSWQHAHRPVAAIVCGPFSSACC